MKSLNLRLPDDVYDDLQFVSSIGTVSMNALLTEAAKAVVQDHLEDASFKEKLNELVKRQQEILSRDQPASRVGAS